jgi:ABC-type multidrug transport system ATPase subunit
VGGRDRAARRVIDFDRVDVVDVTRRFGRRKALARVSLNAGRGDVIGLLGPNGAGKSTLLGVLSTLLRPTSGDVRYGTHVPASTSGEAIRARIGLLGHDLFLYGDLSARENLTFFGRLHGLTDVAHRVDAALAAAGLTDRAGDLVRSFSRGLRQRLALERALLHDPRLVLLDEPFTGLDDESSVRLGARLGTLRERGAIVLMATHEIERAEPLVDAAVCLRDGRLRALGPGAGTLRDRYRAALQETWA